MTDHGALTGLTDDDHPQYIRKAVLTTAGDLYAPTAPGVVTRLPVGADGQVLTARASEPTGLAWETALDSWITSDMVVVDKPITSSLLTSTVVTASATPHTKGAYTTLIASTAGDVTLIRLGFSGVFSAAVATGMLVDIAVGAAGSESVIVPDVNVGFSGGAGWVIPVAVPAGSRISARCQAQVVSDTVSITIQTYAGSNKTLTVMTPLGLVAGSSRGTVVIAGVSGAEGSWTTIIASTAADYSLVYWGVGGAGDTAVVDASALLDIAKGVGGSEVPILSNLAVGATSGESVTYEGPTPFYGVDVPAGSRLSARIQQSASGAQSYDVVLYGID